MSITVNAAFVKAFADSVEDLVLKEPRLRTAGDPVKRRSWFSRTWGETAYRVGRAWDALRGHDDPLEDW